MLTPLEIPDDVRDVEHVDTSAGLPEDDCSLADLIEGLAEDQRVFRANNLNLLSKLEELTPHLRRLRQQSTALYTHVTSNEVSTEQNWSVNLFRRVPGKD